MPRAEGYTGHALKRFFRQRASRRWFAVLLALYLMALCADFLAPYGVTSAREPDKYHPPNLQWVDRDGRAHLAPFVQRTVAAFDEFQRRVYSFRDDECFPIEFFVRGNRYRFLGIWESDLHLFGIRGQSENAPRVYLFGATVDGRDLFSLILHGSRISLTIGLVGVAISFAIGLLVGGFSGYLGGKVDAVVQRVIESIMVLPAFYVILAIRYGFGDLAITTEEVAMSSVHVFFIVVVILSSIYWAGLARVIRGQVLSLRERDFVLAARALGVSRSRIVCRHVLPHTFTYAIVAATLAIPGFILMESALSMLGLGIHDPEVSWGNLLADATSLGALRERPWTLLPGVFITVAVTAFNFLGDGLRDALDPEAIERRP